MVAKRIYLSNSVSITHRQVQYCGYYKDQAGEACLLASNKCIKDPPLRRPTLSICTTCTAKYSAAFSMTAYFYITFTTKVSLSLF